jgi:hypothetical protein
MACQPSQLSITQDPVDTDHTWRIKVRRPHLHVHRSSAAEKGCECQRYAAHVVSDQN